VLAASKDLNGGVGKVVAAGARVAVVAKVEDVVRVAAEAKVAGAGLLPTPASSLALQSQSRSGKPFLAVPGKERRPSRSRHHQPVG
jgi:hypothetical protein